MNLPFLEQFPVGFVFWRGMMDYVFPDGNYKWKKRFEF